MMDHITLHPSDPDAPAALACIACYFQVLADTVPGFRPDMATLPLADADSYRPPHGAFLIAWSGERPVGCVSLRPHASAIAEVKRLWVDPDARGQGLARRLMYALESRARDLGYTDLVLDSNRVLTPAIALYRSTGWTETEPYSDPPANIWMTKPL